MSAKVIFWSASVFAIACTFSGVAIAADSPATTAPAAVAAAAKEAFPNATLDAAALTNDAGLHVYNVELTGDPNVNSAEITPEGLIVFVTQSSGPSELPEAVSKIALPDGYEFISANKHEVRADIKPGKAKFEKLVKPSTVYEVTVAKDGHNSMIQVGEAGNIVAPLTPIVRASADVPKDKLVIRVNCGSDVDYTDRSGVTWSADREYKAPATTADKKTDVGTEGRITGNLLYIGPSWGALGGKTAQRTGLRVPGTDAPGIYDCERYKMGSYRFDVPNGKYTVRMHNCETWEGAKDAGVRVFAVKVNGTVVIERTDVAKDGGFVKPLVKEAKDIEVTDGKLVIEPYPTRTDNDQHPFVNAYEVIAQ